MHGRTRRRELGQLVAVRARFEGAPTRPRDPRPARRVGVAAGVGAGEAVQNGVRGVGDRVARLPVVPGQQQLRQPCSLQGPHPGRLPRGLRRRRHRLPFPQHPGVAPVLERDQHGQQGPAAWREAVLVPDRSVLIRLPRQHARVDQQPQPFGQHLARDAQLLLERVEPVHAARGVPHDQQRPPVAHDVEGLGDRAVGVGQAGALRHGRPSGCGRCPPRPAGAFRLTPMESCCHSPFP